MSYILIIIFSIISLLNPFIDISVGRCLDEQGNGKEYNGEPYYNYINYGGHGDIHTNDIVVTGFILNEYGECEKRLFDVVVLKDTPFEDVGVN